MINIQETQKIINELSYIYPSSQKLLYDNLLISCISEEVSKFWDDNTSLIEGVVKFNIDELAEIVYCGILSESQHDSGIYIKINRPQNIQEKVQEKIDLTQMDKKQLQDFSNNVDKLVNTLQEAKDKSKIMLETIEIANKQVDLDIKKKQQQLLEKLLENN